MKKCTVIKTYHRRGSGGEGPSRLAIFRNFLEKKAVLIPLDHISHVFRGPFNSIICSMSIPFTRANFFQKYFVA